MDMNTDNQIVPVSVEDLTQSVFNSDFIVQADKWEDFVSLWTTCDGVEQISQWFKGDIACKVEAKFGEGGLDKFAIEVGVDYRTMVAYRRTSRAFDLDNRISKLTWTHYSIASQVDSWDRSRQEFMGNERFKWIEKADDEKWSVNRLRVEIVKQKAQESSDTLYQFYADYIIRFGIIIKHWEMNQLSMKQKEELIKILDNLLGEFKNMLLKEEETDNLLTPSI